MYVYVGGSIYRSFELEEFSLGRRISDDNWVERRLQGIDASDILEIGDPLSWAQFDISSTFVHHPKLFF